MHISERAHVVVCLSEIAADAGEAEEGQASFDEAQLRASLPTSNTHTHTLSLSRRLPQHTS